MAELTGQTIAGCEIISELGRGGMGAVYKARQSSLNRIVAVKVMSRDLAEDADFVARFKREAATAAQLHHQNMVLVHSAGEEKGLCYIVMEFVEGRSLEDHITRHGRLAAREALAITVHIAQALQYAWNKSKLIHRDIKPANVFLSNEGEVKVGDLGLAKNVGQSTGGLTQTGTAMGSPLYIAPEQARGIKEIDFRADIYSLGCTLYHMLTGQPPYSGTDAMSIMMKHVSDPPPAIFRTLPGCPMPLGMLVGKMLGKQPGTRHQSYEELIADLYSVTEKIEAASVQATVPLSQPAADVAATAPPAAPAKTPSQPQPGAATPKAGKPVVRESKPVTRDSRLVIGGAVAVAVLLLAGFLWWFVGRVPPRGETAGTTTTAAPGQGTGPTTAASTAAALKLLGNVFTNAVGAEMVYIPPGEFLLGSTKEEQAWAVANELKEEEVKREGEAPRKMRIKEGFWLGRTEVTVGQWKEFVAATGYKTDGEKQGKSHGPQRGQPWGRVDGASWRDPGFGEPPQDNHPVCCVSWNDAVAFCEWLKERERKAGRLAAGQVVRLPTEVEWEYACRAGTQTKFWWGESKEDGKDRLNWIRAADGFKFTSPADSFGARGRNGFGLADMLGNVYEWCLDDYDATQAHEECYKGNPGARVLRGGSFYFSLALCRCAYRNCNTPAGSVSIFGFRVCVGVDVIGAKKSTLLAPSAAPMKEGGILAPAETRASALTTNPKVGEVFTLPLGSNVTMELMGIPPGEFMLGSTAKEREWALGSEGKLESKYMFESGEPKRTAIKNGFWLGRTEVTNGQWQKFVDATGYVTEAEKRGNAHAPDPKTGQWGTVQGASWRNPNFGFPRKENHAVCCISWKDATAFCEWLTETEKKAGKLPAGMVYRLPGEAEWEYACRGGKEGTKFWWGDTMDKGKGRLNGAGDVWGDSHKCVSPVDSFGSRGRNGFGLADMLGNVYEWCLDGFDPEAAHAEPYKEKTSERVLRGGSFYFFPGSVRGAYRYRNTPSGTTAYYGFRVCAGVGW